MLDNPELLKSQAKQYAGKTVNSARWLWSHVPPIHPAGYPFIGAFAVVSLLIALIWHDFLWIGLILTLWCAYFFRDPIRYTPERDGLIVSPADGLVSKIELALLPPELEYADETLYTRISVFLNVFDVHINRVPVGGKVQEVVYRPGKFLNACLDKASEDNERSSVLVELTDGKKLAFVQIAGLIARRIVNNLVKDQIVQTGDHYGLIRFGSRLDIYLPAGVPPLVCVGQRMLAGETVLADLKAEEPARSGVVR